MLAVGRSALEADSVITLVSNLSAGFLARSLRYCEFQVPAEEEPTPSTPGSSDRSAIQLNGLLKQFIHQFAGSGNNQRNPFADLQAKRLAKSVGAPIPTESLLKDENGRW